MNETRIKCEDTTQTVIMKMAEGNIDCLTFLMEFVRDIPDAFLLILKLDSINLYGSRLYMLWNDCCGRDSEKVAKVIRDYTPEAILEHVSGVYGTPFDFQNEEE